MSEDDWDTETKPEEDFSGLGDLFSSDEVWLLACSPAPFLTSV